jgi:hypothetical protein
VEKTLAETGDSFETIVLRELALALSALKGLDSKEKVVSFVRQLGWELPSPDLDLGLADVAKLPALVDKLTQAQSPADLIPAIEDLYKEIQSLFKIIDGLVIHVQSTFANAQNFLNNSGIVDGYEFPRRLINGLVATYVQKRHTGVYSLFVFLGLIEEKAQQADPTHFHSACVLRQVRWERFPKLFENPDDVLNEVYSWGTLGFASDLLLERLGLVLRAFRLPGGLYTRDSDLARALDPGAATAKPGAPGMKELRIPLFVGGHWPQTYVQLGAALARATDPDKSIGLALLPYLLGGVAEEFPVSTGVVLGFKSSAALEGGVALVLMPDKGVTLRTGLLPSVGGGPANMPDGEVSLTLKPVPSTGSDVVLFGQPSRTRIVAQKADVYATGRVVGGQGELVLVADLKGAKIVVSGADFDGFISQVLPKDAISIDFDLEVSWSSKTGLRFSGSAGLEKTFSTHLSILGILDVENIYISVLADSAASSIRGEASATMNISLGPVTANVERMGLDAELLVKPGGKGTLGIADVNLGFKPPTGISLAIKAPEVVGGGHLFFDAQKEQYTGVMQLELAETIALKAIGLLTTRMPDGSKGFSLLVIITAEGFEPIELGFGFTLSGVGGLLGVNRTTAVDVLRSGINNGTVSSILFPQDPVRNAPRIISDLSAVFPPAQNRYVFGPMLMIDWGTPPILTMEIGVVLEIPDPKRVLILGRLQAALPDARNALVLIHMDSLGVIDFGKSEVSLDATLYDSRLLTFVLTGEMALRAEFGAQPSFLLAIGGWNPCFPSPAGFPSLSRMAITLSSSHDARLRLESYLAITSNTLQFGARADFYFAVHPFSVEGFLGFDALFHFGPRFYFIADLSACVALRMNNEILMSVGLNMSLSGPSPWHVWGTAQFSVLCFHVSISIDVQYGPTPPLTLPPSVDVQTLLVAALNDVRNWTSELPAGERPLVVFRTSSTGADVLRVHPLAELVVRERVAPLDMTISRFGSEPVSGANRFSLTAVRSDHRSQSLSVEAVKDSFALAQFTDMSDDQKLSTPAFTQENAGIRFTTGEFAYGYEPSLDSPITYNTLMISPGQSAQKLSAYTMPAAVLDGAASFGAAAKAACILGRAWNDRK